MAELRVLKAVFTVLLLSSEALTDTSCINNATDLYIHREKGDVLLFVCTAPPDHSISLFDEEDKTIHCSYTDCKDVSYKTSSISVKVIVTIAEPQMNGKSYHCYSYIEGHDVSCNTNSTRRKLSLDPHSYPSTSE